MTEEEIKAVTNQHLTSKRLFKPHDLNFVDVFKDKLLLDIVSNGEKGKGAELLEGKFMDTDKVIKKIISSTKACYKISTFGGRPIIGSVLYFGLQPTLGLFIIILERVHQTRFL